MGYIHNSCYGYLYITWTRVVEKDRYILLECTYQYLDTVDLYTYIYIAYLS